MYLYQRTGLPQISRKEEPVQRLLILLPGRKTRHSCAHRRNSAHLSLRVFLFLLARPAGTLRCGSPTADYLFGRIRCFHRLRTRGREEQPSRLSDISEDTITVPTVLTSFNPNTADSATLRQLGLPGWMAKNILRYREKGGKFRKAKDFRKVYGLTEEQYRRLSPYLYIAPEDTTRTLASLYLPKPKETVSINTPSAPFSN